MVNILFVLLQVIILDGVLSIDNAAALAALAKELPKKQQGFALKAGILGAYLGRGILLFFASFIIANHWLSLLGAFWLFYLSLGHFFDWPSLSFGKKGSNKLLSTIIAIEITDLGFSLDNVAAVVGLSSNIWLVIVGVCISILIMRFAAQIFIKLINFEPLLEHAAFVLIFAIAAEIVFRFVGIPITDIVQFSVSVLIILTTLFIGRVKRAYVRG